MVELIDNLLQFFVTLVVCIWTWVLFSKSRKQVYFLLACFYSTFAIGTLYWDLHVLLIRHTPQIFYVSDISWIASYGFLLTLVLTLSKSDKRGRTTPLVWLVPAICVPQLVFYLTYGDYVTNIIFCTMTMAIGWYAVDGLVYAKKQSGQQRNMEVFYLAILCFVGLEYSLWTASCFWISDTLTNPYFWFDFLLTAALAALLPAAKKAVGS